MTRADVIGLYEAHLWRRGLRPSSITRTLDDLRGFVGSRLWWEQATPAEIEGWLDRRPIGPRTRYQWVSRLSVFYRWAVDEGLAASDPTARLVRPRLPPLGPRPIATLDVTRVLLQTPAGPTRTAIALGRYAGLRCCEIARLRWRDVDEAAGHLVVVDGKGGKRRVIPIGPRLAGELPPRAALSGYVMGVAWLPATVSRHVREHLRACGVDGTAHQLRHTYGTEAHRNGADLLTIAGLLGHASVATTQIYCRADPIAARRVAELIG